MKYLTPEAEDAGALAELHVTCWRETYADILPRQVIDGLAVDDKLRLWSAVIADPGMFKLAVRSDDDWVGFIMCGPVREGARLGADGEIHAIYLRKQFRGQGIGTRLMARAAAFWMGVGGKCLVVLSLQANRPAAAFYEALHGRKVHAGSLDMGGIVACDHAHMFPDLPALADAGKSRSN